MLVEVDCDTCLIMQEILSDEIKDEEFPGLAIDNLDKLLSYIAQGNFNIWIHGDITGEMWFGVGIDIKTIVYLKEGGRKIAPLPF